MFEDLPCPSVYVTLFTAMLPEGELIAKHILFIIYLLK